MSYGISQNSTPQQYLIPQNADRAFMRIVPGNSQRIQEDTSPLKWTRRTTQKVNVCHLYDYSTSVPMVWDPKTELVSPQFQVMFHNNFDTVQPIDPNKKLNDTMDRLFRTKKL
jgi:hypothetical protein